MNSRRRTKPFWTIMIPLTMAFAVSCPLYAADLDQLLDAADRELSKPAQPAKSQPPSQAPTIKQHSPANQREPAPNDARSETKSMDEKKELQKIFSMDRAAKSQEQSRAALAELKFSSATTVIRPYSLSKDDDRFSTRRSRGGQGLYLEALTFTHTWTSSPLQLSFISSASYYQLAQTIVRTGISQATQKFRHSLFQLTFGPHLSWPTKAGTFSAHVGQGLTALEQSSRKQSESIVDLGAHTVFGAGYLIQPGDGLLKIAFDVLHQTPGTFGKSTPAKTQTFALGIQIPLKG